MRKKSIGPDPAAETVKEVSAHLCAKCGEITLVLLPSMSKKVLRCLISVVVSDIARELSDAGVKVATREDPVFGRLDKPRKPRAKAK